MKLLTTGLAAFVALAAAVSAIQADDKSLFAHEDGPNTTSTNTSTHMPTSTPAPPKCDMRCIKYHCCWPWGECYCRAEALVEFEQSRAQLDNTANANTSLTPTSHPAPPDGCDPRCNKYHCCNSFHGCNCLAEELDELEQAEEAGITLSIEAASRNINPADIDLGSEANANYKCPAPCGPTGVGCCWQGPLERGRICVCPRGQFPALDRQNEAIARAESSRDDKRSKFGKRYSPECMVLRDGLKTCRSACQTGDSTCESVCDKKTYETPGIKKCEFPKSGN